MSKFKLVFIMVFHLTKFFLSRDVEALTKLSDRLKFEGMTLLLEETSWSEKFRKPKRNYRSSFKKLEKSEDKNKIDSSTAVPYVTRSGRQVNHKKFHIEDETMEEEDQNETPVKNDPLDVFTKSSPLPAKIPIVGEFQIISEQVDKDHNLKYVVTEKINPEPNSNNEIDHPILNETSVSNTQALLRNCPLCEKEFVGKNALGRHMKSMHPENYGPYQCPNPNCDKIFNKGYEILSHIMKDHENVQEIDKKFPCNEVSFKIFKNYLQLISRNFLFFSVF